MRVELANLNHCAVPFLSRASVNFAGITVLSCVKMIMLEVVSNVIFVEIDTGEYFWCTMLIIIGGIFKWYALH